MSHCPNCEKQDGKCSIDNPCCNCMMKMQEREDAAFKKLDELLETYGTEEIHAAIRQFLEQE